MLFFEATDIATAINMSKKAYNRLREMYNPISDEYMLQQFAMDLGAIP